MDKQSKLQLTAARLFALIDSDPAEAIVQARQLQGEGDADELHADAFRAAILIDAGVLVGDRNAVLDAVTILQALVSHHPERIDLLYNLGNGFSALANCEPHDSIAWYLRTAKWRRSGRAAFEKVFAAEVESSIRARAKTNQANILKQSFRWLEAYESYRSAAELDPGNVIATSGAAKILLWAAEVGLGNRTDLERIASRYVALAHVHAENVDRYAGEAARAVLTEIPETIEASEQSTRPFSDYERFVAELHLALSLTVEGLDPDLRRWDSLSIDSVIENLDGGHQAPPLFAMFNVLKADYLAARWQLFQALQEEWPESGSYVDTLDYAAYGVRSSLLVHAQRSAFDIFDKIAVAATEYLKLEGEPNSITFVNRWHVRPKQQQQDLHEWSELVRAEIDAPNPGLIALSEIALDLSAGGFLYEKRMLRHAGTHRFIVLHDLGVGAFRPSPMIEHVDWQEFVDQVLATLRLARAALVHFTEMVRVREARVGRGNGITMPLVLPSHDYVRGEDDDVWPELEEGSDGLA